jgi:hypothetical protein
MSEGEFVVNADGLDTGANSYVQKGDRLTALAVRIGELCESSRIATAAGSDSGGQTFTTQHLESVKTIHDGVLAWAQAVDGTGKALHRMAKSFRHTDEVVTKAAGKLRAGLHDLSVEISNAIKGTSGQQ